MDMTFRWYGENDPVTLDHIRQIPQMSGVVTAIYDVPVGQVWPLERILALKKKVNDKGLKMEVIESVPVHEDIKMGAPSRDKLIDNYCQTIRNLGKAGVKVICYNFMPVFDWLRSDLKHLNADGSTSLAYDQETVNAMDPAKGELSLPGWDESYTKEQLQAMIDKNHKGYTLPNGKHLTLYECSQKMRGMETEIRRSKEGQMTAQAAGDLDLAKQYQAKESKQVKDYKAFCKACGLTPAMDRTSVPGYKRISTK